MTELFFDFMRQGDRISVKPHASPVLRAIHYLLGNLEKPYLTTLRESGGLPAYPSRTKDPYPVDFSNGSVGLARWPPILPPSQSATFMRTLGVGTPRSTASSRWSARSSPCIATKANRAGDVTSSPKAVLRYLSRAKIFSLLYPSTISSIT